MSSATPTTAKKKPKTVAAAPPPSLLGQLAAALASRRIRVVDLTQTLTPEFPQIALPPEMGQCWPFRIEEVSAYDARGPAWYWNNFSCGEHTGTHFDAPVHWVTGKDHPRNTVDTIDLASFIGAAVVIDASAEVARDPDWLLSVEFLEAWEAKHGRIPNGAWVLFRTDWSKRLADPAAFVNMREDGAHTPGPKQQTVEWMIKERDVRGFGVETINTDAGQSYAWPMPYPCHTLMHGANKFGLQCLKNLDQLPPQGAVIVAAPLKIQGGSGSPLRVLALVEP
jgi:kynurenine formamidase